MTITIHNQSAYRFSGWRRTTVSDHPGPQGGVTKSGHLFVVGSDIGIAGYTVDVLVDLEPGQRVTIDTEGATPFSSPVVPLLPRAALADPEGYFGVPKVAGAPLQMVSMEPDGACFLLHLRRRLSGRDGYGLLFDLWLHISGDLRYSVDGGVTFVDVPMQKWATGVLQATCSDVSSPLLRQDVPFDVRLECGGASVYVGTGFDRDPFLLAGDWFADGQCKRWPVEIAWQGESDYNENASKIHAFGLERIGFLGTPAEQGNLDIPAWLASRLPKVEAALSDWSAPWNIGVPANSTNAGDEEEQGFSQGFEAFYPGGIAAVRTRLLEAYIQGRRPCHHLERDGSIVDPANHPDYFGWQSRPHRLSPDQFNKPRTIGAGQTHGGWYGPDREHWLIHTTAAAYELTGDPALQDELRHQAMLFLGGETVKPGWSTSSTDAARSAGYAGMVVCHLWRLLKDRSLAERVRDRWIQRLELVYIPRWGHLDWWQWVPTYTTDSQGIKHPTTMGAAVGMNVPYAVMAYQQAVGAFGLYVASRMFDHQGGMDLAMRGARAVWHVAYHDGICYETLGLTAEGDFVGRYVEGDGAHSSMNFAYEWTPLAVWVAAQYYPAARTFYATLREQAHAGARNDRAMDWFPEA